MILATKLARDRLVYSLNSYPSLQAIVDSNNIYLKTSYHINFLSSFLGQHSQILLISVLLNHPKTTPAHMFTLNFKNTILQYSNYSKIYTSKFENNMRIAIIYKLPKKCSIYTAEATTILKTLEYALEKSKQNFIILSDSPSTIFSIANTHNPIAKEIHLVISAHNFNENLVKKMWVPSHSSIEGIRY